MIYIYTTISIGFSDKKSVILKQTIVKYQSISISIFDYLIIWINPYLGIGLKFWGINIISNNKQTFVSKELF